MTQQWGFPSPRQVLDSKIRSPTHLWGGSFETFKTDVSIILKVLMLEKASKLSNETNSITKKGIMSYTQDQNIHSTKIRDLTECQLY